MGEVYKININTRLRCGVRFISHVFSS